ncbi:NEL-type E3 ubiquitin ligase domain-containing protein [Pseudomonas sp. SDO528_S397]
MTPTRDLISVTDSVTSHELDAVLLELTGDLDKARVLRQTLPHWLVEAKAETLRALEQAHAESLQPRRRARSRLARLASLESFCVARLEAFLVQKGVTGLDVRRDMLELPKRSFRGVSPDLGGALVETVTVARHSLVQAAMQNFTQAQADGSLSTEAKIRSAATGQALTMPSALDFVGYCRELDLGKAYQQHITEVMGLLPADDADDAGLSYNTAVADIGQSRCLDMQIDLHIALARQAISPATHARLLGLIKADRPASQLAHLAPAGKPWAWQGLNIGGACLWGVMVIGDDTPGHFDADTFVVYMPNEPVRPWFEYTSQEDFKVYLTLKLQVASYQAFFKHYLDESERLDFFSTFDRTRTLGPLTTLATTGSFSTFFFRACVGKIQLDARVLAVPVAEVDEDAREKRLERYLELGLDLLNVAGFVVPVLGQLMMGVAVGQILGEVYEGVEDWIHHDNTEALRHLVNVAESVAAMALFAVGGKVVGSLKRSLADTTKFFDRFEAVRLSDDQPRLWRNRLLAYHQPRDLDLQTVANDLGVYQTKGRSYIKMDDELYGISYDAALGKWRINHPTRAHAYRPLLEHNHQGGWQQRFERPQQWANPAYHLTRLDPSLASLEHERLTDIASITDMSLADLTRLNQLHDPLPERFHDCVARFRQDQHIRDLMTALEQQTPPHVDTARTQMLALPLAPGWPKGRFFEVLDDEGHLLESYPDVAPFDYEDLSIHITHRQLKAGEVMPTLLQALDDEERSLLLGQAVEPEAAQKRLAQVLLDTIKTRYRTLQDHLYRDYDGTATPPLVPLASQYPQLPKRQAWELLGQMSRARRAQLRTTRRVPLVLAQRVNESLALLEEDQALLGLYLPQLATDPTRQVAAGLLEHVPAWPKDVALQVRDQTLRGSLLAEAGPAQARVRCSVLKTPGGFQAVDEVGAALGAVRTGPDGFYQALVDTVPARQRPALGLHTSTAAERLRNQLRLASQERRDRVAGLLRPAKEGASAQPAACVQAQSPVDAPWPTGLVRKVAKLYPLFDDGQVASFIQHTGSDHLSRAHAVEALEEQHQALHRALKTWRKDRTSYTEQDGPLWDYRLSRHQVARMIERCWQRMVVVADRQGVKAPGLVLTGMLKGPLPTLPPQVSFEHVRYLSLQNLALDDDAAYFIKHFKGLRVLDLSGNQLTRVPEVLTQLPYLNQLVLANNNLQMTPYARARLAELRSLEVLNLSDNPLLDPPLINRMFDLRELVLRNCRLKTFPDGALRLPYLELVDLRQNDIRTLPDGLFKLARRQAESFNLRNNPLDALNQQLVQDYRNSVGTGMGYAEDDIPRLNEQRAKELWLPDAGVEAFEDKQRVWNGLKDEPGSDALFKLLADLGGTADASQVREDLNQRIWRVLRAGAGHEGLRDEIFQRAATPLNCDDAAADSFGNLEILVELHEAAAFQGQPPPVKTLLELGKGLYRLDMLGSIARRHSADNPGADPLEVSLAYRTGLAEKLHLPGQPRNMRFASLGGVTPKALMDAETQLRAADLSAQRLQFLAKLPFWISYLKRTAANRFAEVNEPFARRLEAVFDQAQTLDDASYREQMNLIQHEQQAAEHAEVVRQTEAALKLDDLGGCVLR